MQRDYKVYLDDILNSIDKIERYCSELSFDNFIKDERTNEAVIMNLAIIGEAVRNIPHGIRIKYYNIEWEKISALRNIIIHEYFGINFKIIWDIVKNKLPILRDKISEILAD